MRQQVERCAFSPSTKFRWTPSGITDREGIARGFTSERWMLPLSARAAPVPVPLAGRVPSLDPAPLVSMLVSDAEEADAADPLLLAPRPRS